MKKFLLTIIAMLLIAAVCAACTPGVLLDTLNGFATSGNAARYVTPNVASPGDLVVATAGNIASPGNIVTPGSVG